eukprot:jgi/Psemu1/57815/gm1.57815_g
MVDQFDWNAIDGILFRFSGNSPYDEQLNAVYSMIMDDIDMADLFVENADAKVLAPFMMTNLRGSIASSITYCLPSLTDSQKGHITQLLSECTIAYVTYTGATKKVRGPIDLEKAAKEALTHHTHASTQPIITIELVITEWQFKSTWRAHRFDKVYAIPIPVPSSCAGIPPVTPVEPAIPVPSQTNTALTFNDKLIEQLKQERHGDTLQHVIPPKSKHPKTTCPANGGLFPIKPIESEVAQTIQVPKQCTFESSNDTSPVIVSSGTTDLVHTTPIDPNNVETSLNCSPNGESVSFRRVRSDSFRRATSSSRTPIQCQDKSTVTAPSVTPSALTRFGHHSVPPPVPANFGWTFNPQNEIATFHRSPKIISLPNSPIASSLQPLWPKASHDNCHAICPHPNPTVLGITKRHIDALKITLYHLHANILSMNWFFDTID